MPRSLFTVTNALALTLFAVTLMSSDLAHAYTVPTTGPNKYCVKPVSPMTNQKNDVKNAIDDMAAGGDTMINMGLAWGWRMLSPKWRGLWGGAMDSNNLPLDYNGTHTNKALILLTDGVNTFGPGGSYYEGYTAYEYLTYGRLLKNENPNSNSKVTNATDSKANLDTKTLALCNEIKSHNIYLYVVALDTDNTMDAATKTMLQNCATAISYYFYAPDTSQLNGIFGKIGDSLSNLRVSK
ncbi:MAG: hypothetical protein PHW63_09155 [Alphaproteobacteria bacterium]|nr:hypothetical protein [Alphaproteobacteria bacterium]